MRQHDAGVWGVLALSLAFTLLAVTLGGPTEGAAVPVSVVIHDHGMASAAQPGSARFREMGVQAKRLVGAARTELAALALPWEAAERCKREQVSVEVIFAAPGVRAGIHGVYAMALIPLDEMHEPGRVHVYLGTERYTLLVPADADEELARLCELAGVAVPPVQRGPLGPTVAPVQPTASRELAVTPTPAPTAQPTASPAPGATVRGRVVEGYGGHRPVARLPLWLGSESEGHPTAYTGLHGEFVLPNVPPGTHEVVNSHLFFEVTVAEGVIEVDVGTLKYPLVHPPPYHYRTPVPLACLEELLTYGQALEFTICAEDSAWRRPTEPKQRETVWAWRPFSDLGEPTLSWWFERSALLYEGMDRLKQSYPGGPRLDEAAADQRYLLGAWNSAMLEGSEWTYEGSVLDDLVARRRLEVWLLGYRAVEVRRLGEHYAVAVWPTEGLQVIRFAGDEDVVAVHVVCEGVELACLPEHPPATLARAPVAQPAPAPSADEVAVLPAPAVSLATDPRDGAVVYALLANNALYRSGDGGHTWRRLPLPAREVPYNPVPKAEPANYVPLLPQQAITVARGRPERVFVVPVQAVEGATPLYRSDDGGATWETVREDVGAWAVGGERGGILYAWRPGDEGGIYRSDDGGDTWVQAYAGSFPAPAYRGDDPCGREGITALVTGGAHANLVYAGTDHGLFRSADGGRTWAPFMEGVPASVRAYRRVALLAQGAARTMYGVVELWPDARQGCAQLVRLGPGAAEWEGVGSVGLGQLWVREASYGEELSGLHTLAADPAVPGRLYLGTPTGLLVSDDAGASWEVVPLPAPPAVYRVAVGPAAADDSSSGARLYLWTGRGFMVAAAP